MAGPLLIFNRAPELAFSAGNVMHFKQLPLTLGEQVINTAGPHVQKAYVAPPNKRPRCTGYRYHRSYLLALRLLMSMNRLNRLV